MSRPSGRNRFLLSVRLLVAATVPLCAGCGAISARPAVVRAFLVDRADRVDANHRLAGTTRALLDRRRISAHDPGRAAASLESAAPSDPDAPLALAELWYRTGLKRSHGDVPGAMSAFRDAAAAAAIAIEADSDLDAAVEIHNDAVGRLIRLASRKGEGRGWSEALAGVGVTVAAEHPPVEPSRFVSIRLASDVRVGGMRRVFRGPGFGVPIVGLRENDRRIPAEPNDSYLPKTLLVGATATARPAGTIADGSWRSAPLALVFHDPFAGKCLPVGGRNLRMAWDTTTALAIQAGRTDLARATRLGLLNSNLPEGIEPGLYMLRPYQPGKEPVVFVHGLNSSPDAFVQALNELRNDPEMERRYQFLLFAYPTGRPIVGSARRLRSSLYEAESKFGADPAFHRTTLIGHSMGGNLTRCMVTDSGMALWNAHLNVPPEALRASPESLAELREILIFRPVPFVRRAVFVAAPHKGSPVADGPIGWAVSRLISPPAEQVAVVEELTALNGPEVFKREAFQNRGFNSIGALSRRSPTLLAVDELPIAPGVRAHSILFDALGVLPTDLVVPRSSASVPGVETELVLPGTHFSEQSRGAVAEMRRILAEPLGP